MASVRDQILQTCFLCAILYAAEQDILRWLAIEEPDRQPQIYFDFDTFVVQYETEVQALIGQDVRFFYRTREDRPRNALKVFLRDGVRAYSKSKEWIGEKIIYISSYQFHKDMTFQDFENIISTGGSVIGGFPVGIEFKDLKPDEIYEFSPPDIKRQPAGAHMVQFIGTGTDVGREFLVFLNSKKQFAKDGVGKVYFDQIYNGVYTLQCRAPPPPPPSDDPGLIVAGTDDNDDTLGSSGAAPDGNNMSSFSGDSDDNNAPSSIAPTKSLSQVGKRNIYDDNPVSCCAVKIAPSAPALLVEDIQTKICASIVKIERMSKQLKANLLPPPELLSCVAIERMNCDIYGPWKKKNLDEIGIVTRYFVASNKMNDLHFTNVLLKIYEKLGLEHRQSIPTANRIPTLILGRDLSHGSPGLSDIPSSAGVSNNQHGRKHKEPISSSGPANSSGIMNTTGPFFSLASSTMPLMHHNASISSRLVVFGADATGARESPTDHTADKYHFLEDDWLGYKVDSFLSGDDSAGPKDARTRCMACTKGFTFRDIYSAGGSTKKVACFHFSSDGKLLATGGHNMKLGRLPLDLAALQDCKEEVEIMFPSTSPNPNVPNWSTEGAISHAKIEDKKAMEKRHRERRKILLKSQADTAFRQKEHKMASQIYGLAICHKESAALYANRSLRKLLIGDGEGALSDALRWRMLRSNCTKACYLQAAVLMLLKEYTQARDAILDSQKLDPGNAEIESELRKARELMKNPPAEGAY